MHTGLLLLAFYLLLAGGVGQAIAAKNILAEESPGSTGQSAR